jgi:hypothetical protein
MKSRQVQELSAGPSEQGTIDATWPCTDCVSEALNLELESSVEQNAVRIKCISHYIGAECDTALPYCW